MDLFHDLFLRVQTLIIFFFLFFRRGSQESYKGARFPPIQPSPERSGKLPLSPEVRSNLYPPLHASPDRSTGKFPIQGSSGIKGLQSPSQGGNLSGSDDSRPRVPISKISFGEAAKQSKRINRVDNVNFGEAARRVAEGDLAPVGGRPTRNLLIPPVPASPSPQRRDR